MISMTWAQMQRSKCSYNGVEIHLSKVQTRIIAILLMRRGQYVPIDDIIEYVYPDPDDEPDWPRDAITVQMSLIRRKMPGLIGTPLARHHTIDRPGMASPPKYASLRRPYMMAA